MTVEEIVKVFYEFGDEKRLSENLKWFRNCHGFEFDEAVSEENLKCLEERFGEIPNGMREIYSICRNNINLITCQDEWILPAFYKHWKWLCDYKGLVIANENQGVCQAVINESDLEKENPPVYVITDGEEGGRLSTNSLDEFIKAFLVYSNAEFYFISEEEFEFIKSNLKEYDFKLTNWIVDGEIRLFYDTPGSVVCVFADDLQMNYGAMTEEAFNRLEEIIGDFGELM